MQHRGSEPAHPGWTRAYDYGETSLIEDGSGGAALKQNNRLTRTRLDPNGADPPQVEPCRHDAHGNITHLSHLGGGAAGPNLVWDFRDRLVQSDLGGGGTAYYVYDAGGRRVRKVWQKAAGLIEERIYLGNVEVHRRHNGAVGPGSATRERETQLVTDGAQTIAMVETRTLDSAGNDPAPPQLVRYQVADHLGSTRLELDDAGWIISYEEYSPYGSSTYQAVRRQTESPKRYRYTGKERDEETGLYYFGARYYASWLGRWASCDPSMRLEDPNAYAYVTNDPIAKFDPDGRREFKLGSFAWGAAVAAVTIVAVVAVVATAGAAAPGVGIGIGMLLTASAEGTAAAITFGAGLAEATTLSVGIAGAVDLAQTMSEVTTGQERGTNRTLTDEEWSERAGSAAVGAAAVGIAGAIERYAERSPRNASQTADALTGPARAPTSTIPAGHAPGRASVEGPELAATPSAEPSGTPFVNSTGTVVVDDPALARLTSELPREASPSTSRPPATSPPPPLHPGHQAKHGINYDPAARKSILLADPKVLAERAGTGTPVGNIPRGAPNFKERVDFGETIGHVPLWKGVVVPGEGTRYFAPTSIAEFRYNAKGQVHIFATDYQPR